MTRFAGMRIILFVALFFVHFKLSAQEPYNRMIKVNMGMSGEQLDYLQIKNAINDTGSVKMEFLSWTPTMAYTHEFMMGQIFSLSGTVGFQYMNLYYGPQYYGAPYFFVSVNPQVSIVHRKRFEYYIKLKVGSTFYIHRPDVIPEPTRRILPETANLFTGVTIGGFNYFVNDHLGLNLELSIWSPEMATFGLSYRFFRGEIPELQNENDFNNPIEQNN